MDYHTYLCQFFIFHGGIGRANFSYKIRTFSIVQLCLSAVDNFSYMGIGRAKRRVGTENLASTYCTLALVPIYNSSKKLLVDKVNKHFLASK